MTSKKKNSAKPEATKRSRKDAPGNAAKILVTGFDAFGGADGNPTEEIAKSMNTEIKVRGLENLAVHPTVLPTCCDLSWKTLRKQLKKHGKGPTVLIMTGLAESRSGVEFERVALNLRDYRIEDNEGHKWPATPIHAKGKEAFISDLPLEKWATALRKKGIPAGVSNHAGSFVCNEIYYRALRYQAKNEHPSLVLFVHVPLPENIEKSAQASKKASEKSSEKETSNKSSKQAKKNDKNDEKKVSAIDGKVLLNRAIEEICRLCATHAFS